MTDLSLVKRVKSLLRASRLEDAEQLALSAFDGNLRSADSRLSLALIRLHQERDATAATLFAEALALNPGSAEAFIGRARLRRGIGPRAGMESDLLRALELEGLNAPFARIIAHDLFDRNRPSDAVELARLALGATSQSTEAVAILVEAIGQLGAREQASAMGQTAVTHYPWSATLRAVLGSLHAAQGRFGPAVEELRRARALDPSNDRTARNLAQALVSHANTRRFDGRLDAAMAALHEAASIGNGDASARSLLMFCLLSRADTTLGALHSAARAAGTAHEASITPMARAIASVRRPIRVGFLAPKLTQSSVKYFLRPIFDHHDSTLARLYLYDEGGGRQAVEHDRLVRGLAAWRDIRGLDNTAVARHVRDDEIDVLVDLAGHGWYGRRLGVFAYRPAPVQVTCIGYPGTVGMASIGHRLTDRHLHPPGCGERFDEKLIFLPNVFCYDAPDDAPAVAARSSSSSGRVTFGSFNQLAKIDNATLRLWAAVLAAIPAARLLIKRANLADGKVISALRARLVGHGIAAHRVDFLGPRDSHSGHLAAYEEVDIALDTFPYNGTTTTCEALWMGVPVVTRVGDREVSRTGLSLLATAGLDAWAANDDAAYVRIASKLAADIAALSQLRSGLRHRIARSALCDGPAYARHFLTGLGTARVDTQSAIW